MKLNLLISAIFIQFFLSITAKTPQVHIYCNNDKDVYILEDDFSVNHLISDSTLCLSVSCTELKINADSISEIKISNRSVPKLFITIPENPDLPQITEKETYLDAVLSLDGNSMSEDLPDTSVSVKGRGNSSWGFRKKPIRLKFPKKTSLAGFKKAKSYVLLANYLDPSHMRNAVAFKIAQLMNMEFTNHFQPVNIIFNGNDLGLFLLTEKIGINSAGVDIDENTGILFEMSKEYDEEYKFRSAIYDLPVMVKDPDINEITAANPDLGTPQDFLEIWQKDFNNAEKAAYYGNADVAFDINSFTDFLLICDLAVNNEIGHPKSCYLYKEKPGVDVLYKAGPIWDFDVAYNFYSGADGSESSPYVNLWLNGLYGKIMRHPAFQEMYRSKLKNFKENILPELLTFINEYSEIIKPYAIMDGAIWPEEYQGKWYYRKNSGDFINEAAKLSSFIIQRTDYLMEQYKIEDEVEDETHIIQPGAQFQCHLLTP